MTVGEVRRGADGSGGDPGGGPGGGPAIRAVAVTDPAARPMISDLIAEYTDRYGAEAAREEMAAHPASDFAAPHGAFLLAVARGAAVAGGAFRRFDPRTAELKRIWTAATHRRRGLGRRIVAALEAEAAARGYTRVFLTTGPHQPEAVALYAGLGYRLLETEGTDEAGRRRYYAFDKELGPDPDGA
ncbi:GNAT superfamily N-acetyltransferase [Spinactinospora alkalitolerans]|uniref:GNAT superfamily N-acetyltransferase n=1 Tax=Spinactinospora alkalitolerans TaxID=687207 RepID=A0A852TUG8_9ACTN|nr:GNAT family N-acetyltransferase [Spinactinospora alkalitolerans]NYE47679.1 GNAT superfamily N-acetyltransferase [Spinactinospora alkalitolerans]